MVARQHGAENIVIERSYAERMFSITMDIDSEQMTVLNLIGFESLIEEEQDREWS